jgi:hypothetical protein
VIAGQRADESVRELVAQSDLESLAGNGPSLGQAP